MPQIVVTAGDAADLTEGTVTLRERINASDFESDRFVANLLERLGWAVGDATEVEVGDATASETGEPTEAEAEPAPPEELRYRASASVVTTAS